MTVLADNNRSYVSLFAGIEGFGIALEQAGWNCHTRVEIDGYCNQVTAGWLPFGRGKRDVRRTAGGRFRGVGLVCGGFPCQDLSVAGKRKGLAGKRSGLFHEMVRIVAEARPRWLLWENVPGLLSSNGGRDFWSVNAALAEIGYFGAWRVLDSQYFGVAQRRRRVFGLYAEGDTGARRAAAVLLEPEGGGWDPAASRRERQGDSGAPAGGAEGAGGEGIAPAVTAKQAKQAGGPAGDECQNPVPCHRSNPYDDSDAKHGREKLVCFVQNTRDEVRMMNGDDDLAFSPGNLKRPAGAAPSAECPTLRAEMGDHLPCVVAPTLSTKNEVTSSSTQREAWMEQSAELTGTVRRLTPTECERLQGFPVGWTIPRDKWTGWTLPKGLDSARYRALGNAVTTNVVYWIVLRINMVEALLAEMGEELR